MAILLTSGNPLGLRALGSGGRTAVASYEQITRTLRQSLGPEHAALFAEPSSRTATIDWFANVDADDKPIRLTEASPDLRERGLAQLDRLVRDIEAKAVALQKSDRQDERILGDMLAHALDIPDEDAVFMVGEQPVMTFWGYVRDQGRPALSPIHALLRRRSPTKTEAGADAALAADAEAAKAQPPVDPPLVPDTIARSPDTAAARIVPAFLWAIFALLLLTSGVQLLRGCAIGLPRSLTGWLIDYCPASADTGVMAALAAERAKQEQFQAEYDELVRQAALKRQACQIKTGKGDGPQTPIPEPIVKPPEPPNPPDPVKDQMRIPDKASDGIPSLEGCWRAHEGLTETQDGKDTGKKLKVTYCFNKDGTGSRTIRYEDDGAQCRGAVRARLSGDGLTFDIDDAVCEGGHGHYQPAVDQCRRGDAGVAVCDEVPTGETKPNFKDFPFTRTTEQP